MQLIDLTGQRFGRLTVLHRGTGVHPRFTYWVCQCDCGQRTTPSLASLRQLGTQSCGCLGRERTRARSLTHGATQGRKTTPEYHVWAGMKRRCFNPHDAAYKNYGGRGITVCARWQHDFAAFLADMGPRPSMAHSIERQNNNGNYAPDNCVWATAQEQVANRRPQSVPSNVRLNLTGHCFGRLTALELVRAESNKPTLWKCRCLCGQFVVVTVGRLRSGHTQSCGCLHREMLVRRNKAMSPLPTSRQRSSR